MTPHEKAILEIASLASKMLEKAEETKDQGLLQIAMTLNLFMATAVNGDFEEYLDHCHEFIRLKVEQRAEGVDKMIIQAAKTMGYVNSKEIQN
jgi:RNA processing factor Prp31